MVEYRKFPWDGKTYHVPMVEDSGGLVDLAGEPLTVETLMQGKRVIEGKPDLDELIGGVHRMIDSDGVEPKGLRLHPQDFQRLFSTVVGGVSMSVFDDKGFILDVAGFPLAVKADSSIPPTGWRLENEAEGVGMDAMVGPIRRARVQCPQCGMKVEAWVAVDWKRSKPTQQALPKSEEAEFLERLRLKVKANYTQQQDVIRAFVRFVAKEGTCLVEQARLDAFVQKFLEDVVDKP
jgi:hypothetical protein